MFLVDPADIIAVHRANDTGGHDAAIAEIRRRWPALADLAVAGVFARVLVIKVDVPGVDPAAAELEHQRSRAMDKERQRLRWLKARTE